MLSVVGRCKTTSLMKLGYGELALERNRRDGAEINLWALIVVKLSELGILKRYLYTGTVLITVCININIMVRKKPVFLP